MSVEKLSDELWIGAKDQSNSVIAGSLRNLIAGVRLWGISFIVERDTAQIAV